MKAVLISINPKWCKLIASGEKTVEVRKTKPKCKVPFKCYIYETQGRTETPWVDEEGHYIFKGRGKVIGEFVCDRSDEFSVPYPAYFGEIDSKTESIIKSACLNPMDIHAYNGTHKTYGWHITDLVVYDEPKELSEFWTIKCTNKKGTCGECKTKPNCIKPTTRPPQSWCYVEVWE